MINYYQKRPKKEYALYKDDKFIRIGTKKELAEYINVFPATIQHYKTPSYNKKVGKNSYIVIDVEE